jgi:hypothetical protein
MRVTGFLLLHRTTELSRPSQRGRHGASVRGMQPRPVCSAHQVHRPPVTCNVCLVAYRSPVAHTGAQGSPDDPSTACRATRTGSRGAAVETVQEGRTPCCRPRSSRDQTRRAGEHGVHLRVQRGRVIEVARRVALRASFTVEADELTWAELVTPTSNEFMRRSVSG